MNFSFLIERPISYSQDLFKLQKIKEQYQLCLHQKYVVFFLMLVCILPGMPHLIKLPNDTGKSRPKCLMATT